MKLNIVFMGTASIAIPVLEFLQNHPLINLSLVIAPPSKPAGRGYELKDPETVMFCKKHKISFYQSENINKDEKLFEDIKKSNIDVIIVFAFSQFLGKKYLDLAKFGAFNIHTSLLPKYRGASPIQYSLLNGDKITGVCLQKMVSKMDAGDIIVQKTCDIKPYDNAPILHEKLKALSIQVIDDFIYQLYQNSIIPTKQDESKISFAPLIKKEDGFIDFTSMQSEEIINKLRAYTPWPGCSFEYNGERIQICEMEIIEESLVTNKQLIMKTSDAKFIRIKKLKRSGKKIQEDLDFLRGYHGKKN